MGKDPPVALPLSGGISHTLVAGQRQHAHVDREAHEAVQVPDAELAHQVRAMLFYGLGAEAQALANLAVGAPLDHQPQHGAFAAGQRVPELRAVSDVLLRSVRAATDPAGAGRGMALHDEAHLPDQLIERCVLDHVAVRAGGERLPHMVFTPVNGQDDDPDARALALDGRDCFEAAAAGHRQIHEDQVGQRLPREAMGFDPAACLADDAVVVQFANHAAKAAAQ
ncbi:hypothetical protein NECAME_17883 [Necator americanus]|uniref:Uncharacterized protein n=1 Tax=Necator americanus TaxID=51031 RepID=W2THK8_NECAM|nr:hypothetical protein NECAME_17883 [Necator americanus]ETN81555.1 hypothetical protein NECAME_17883 [Necator americanus]